MFQKWNKLRLLGKQKLTKVKFRKENWWHKKKLQRSNLYNFYILLIFLLMHTSVCGCMHLSAEARWGDGSPGAGSAGRCLWWVLDLKAGRKAMERPFSLEKLSLTTNAPTAEASLQQPLKCWERESWNWAGWWAKRVMQKPQRAHDNGVSFYIKELEFFPKVLFCLSPILDRRMLYRGFE